MNSKSGRRAAATRGARSVRRREPAHAPGLVDQARDRHANEDRRLLDGAHAALHGEPLEVGQRERHPLVGEAPRAWGHHVGGEPPEDVAVGNGVRIAHAHPHAARIAVVAQQRAQMLRAEGPVELMGLAAGARHGQLREHLLLVRGQLLAEPPHQLRGGHRPSPDGASAPRPPWSPPRRGACRGGSARPAGRARCRRCRVPGRPAPAGRTPARRAPARGPPRRAARRAWRRPAPRSGTWSPCPSSR